MTDEHVQEYGDILYSKLLTGRISQGRYDRLIDKLNEWVVAQNNRRGYVTWVD